MPNALEVDFLPVGDNSRSGDAIALRFGDYENSVWTNQKVFIIDGGNGASGEALVNHVTEVYKTNYVDRVILTHPDADHASGLRTVVDKLKVGKIWMHCPWNHWDDLKDSIHDGRITKTSFGKRMQEAYQFAYEIEQIALQKKIEIYRPKQGAKFAIDDGETILQVLGPGKDLYLSLIQASVKTPHMEVAENVIKSYSESKVFSAIEDLSFESENLSEEDEDTSAENDMSLVLYLTVANQKILFTGDSGTMGLYKAIHYAIENKIDLKQLNFFQVPHHGSKHNISKGILKNIYAPFAIISCAKFGEPSHPSKIVTNSLIRRNIKPYRTQGTLLCHRSANLPIRPGMVSATPISFHSTVEL